MDKIKIDRHKFSMAIYDTLDTRFGDHIMKLLDEAKILPKCTNAVCDDDHNWKYKNLNYSRKCKWCGEKQGLSRGEWVLFEHLQ